MTLVIEDSYTLEEISGFLHISMSTFYKHWVEVMAMAKVNVIPHTRPKRMYESDVEKFIKAWNSKFDRRRTA